MGTTVIAAPAPDDVSTLTMDYCGHIIYENGKLKRIRNPEGYLEKTTKYVYNYYLRDHLGNNRTVLTWNGNGYTGSLAVSQAMNYYPSGMPYNGGAYGDIHNSGLQPYKFGDKEYETMYGLNQYYQGARFFGSDLPITPTQDPLAEKYYDTSPYVQYGNNPVRYIDPTGEDWYEDEDGNVMWRKSQDAEYTDENGKIWKNIGTEYLVVTGDEAMLFQQETNDNGDLYLKSSSCEIIDEQTAKLEADKEAVRSWQSSDASRSAQQTFWDNPTFGNWIKYCLIEALSQYTDPYKVIGGLSAGVAGYSSIGASKQYAPRVRARGVQDPVSHNFPYSFDDVILSSRAIPKGNGYYIYQLRGAMNEKPGFFEIGRNKLGVIDHRFFRPM